MDRMRQMQVSVMDDTGDIIDVVHVFVEQTNSQASDACRAVQLAAKHTIDAHPVWGGHTLTEGVDA